MLTASKAGCWGIVAVLSLGSCSCSPLPTSPPTLVFGMNEEILNLPLLPGSGVGVVKKKSTKYLKIYQCNAYIQKMTKTHDCFKDTKKFFFHSTIFCLLLFSIGGWAQWFTLSYTPSPQHLFSVLIWRLQVDGTSCLEFCGDKRNNDTKQIRALDNIETRVSRGSFSRSSQYVWGGLYWTVEMG